MSMILAALAALLFGLSLLNVLKAPTVTLWKLSVLTSEWGHVLAIASALLAVFCLTGLLSGKNTWYFLAVGLTAKLSLVFFLRPTFEAWLLAKTLPANLTAAFGASKPIVTPFAAPLLFLREHNATIERLVDLPSAAPGSSLSCEVISSGSFQGRRPGIVVIHGGGWDSGDHSELRLFNRRLASLGYLVFAIDYRLAPKNTWPAQAEDVSAAVTALISKADDFGLDPNRLALLGRSAGGQIALSVAYSGTLPSLRGVIALYAPADLLFAWYATSERDVLDSKGLMSRLIGTTPDRAPSLFRDASPFFAAKRTSVPTLLIHGDNDPLVWQRQSARLHERLGSLGVPSFFLEIPYATHAFDFNPQGPSAQLTLYAIDAFLSSTAVTHRQENEQGSSASRDSRAVPVL